MMGSKSKKAFAVVGVISSVAGPLAGAAIIAGKAIKRWRKVRTPAKAEAGNAGSGTRKKE